MYLSTNKALCFLLHSRPMLSVKPIKHFVMLWVALPGLAYPKAGPLTFNSYYIYLL